MSNTTSRKKGSGLLNSYLTEEEIKQSQPRQKGSDIAAQKNTGSAGAYLGTQLVTGLTGVFENTGRWLSGTLYDIVGDDRMADYTFKSRTWSEKTAQTSREKYNPGAFMSFAGDVSSGLGQSSAFLLNLTGAPIGTIAFAGGAIGGATADAVRKTGEAGLKEYAYGAISGGIEFGLEAVTGFGGTKIATAAAKGAKSVGWKIARQATRNGVVKGMLTSAAGEFTEEFLSAVIDPKVKQITGVDKNARASMGEALYAGLTGFVSGGIMGGASQSTVNAFHYATGKKVVANKNEGYIVNTARNISESFKAEAGSLKLLNDSIYNLKASLAAYDKAKGETRKTMLLGEMWDSISRLEASDGVQAMYNRIVNNATEENAKAASYILGKTVTLATLKSNKNGVAEEYAINAWALEFLSESRETEIQSIIDNGRERAVTPNLEREISDIQAGGQAVYKNGDTRYVVSKNKNGTYNVGVKRNGTEEWQITKEVNANHAVNTVMNTVQNTVQNTPQANIYASSHDVQDTVLTQPAAASAPTSAPGTNYSLPNSNLDNESPSGYNENKNENIGSDEDGEEVDQRGRIANYQRTSNGTGKEDSERSRIQKRVGEEKREFQENNYRKRRNRGISDYELFSDVNNHLIPEESSELHKITQTIKDAYGLKCYVIKKSAWKRENPACAAQGKIYICENIDKNLLLTLVPHETTHVMKQLEFDPYIEFVDGVPDLVNIKSQAFDEISRLVAEHNKINFFEMDAEQRTHFYDELNATVYGYAKGNIFDNPQFDCDWIKEAFYDFDAYISELSEIHEQFKEANTAYDAENLRYNAQDDKNTGNNTPTYNKTQNTAKKSSEDEKETPANNAGVTKLSVSEEKEGSPGVDEAYTADDSRAPSTAKEQTEARRYYKDFDILAPDARAKIIRMVRSADKYKVSAVVKRFAANVIAERDIDVIFDSRISAEGLHNTNARGERLIVINPERASQSRSVEKIVLHEVFHDIADTREGKNLISELKARKDFDTVRRDYKKRYKEAFGKDIRGKQLDEKAAADLLASLLGNERWINRLAAERPNIVVRAWRSIEDLFTYAKGKNLAELRTMRKLLRMYDKAVAESGIGDTYSNTEPNIQYSVAKDNNGNNVVVMFDDILKNITDKPHQAVADIIAAHIGEYYTIFESGQKVYIGEDLPGEYTQSKYTQNILKHRLKILKAKNQASQNLGEMIEIATNRKWEKAIHSNNKDAKYGFYRYTTRFAIPTYDSNQKVTGANIYQAELLIRNASDGKKYLYDIVSIKKENSSSLPNSWITKIGKNSSSSLTNSISQNAEKSTPLSKNSFSPGESDADKIFAPKNMSEMSRNQRRAIKGGKTTASWMSAALLREVASPDYVAQKVLDSNMVQNFVDKKINKDELWAWCETRYNEIHEANGNHISKMSESDRIFVEKFNQAKELKNKLDTKLTEEFNILLLELADNERDNIRRRKAILHISYLVSKMRKVTNAKFAEKDLRQDVNSMLKGFTRSIIGHDIFSAKRALVLTAKIYLFSMQHNEQLVTVTQNEDGDVTERLFTDEIRDSMELLLSRVFGKRINGEKLTLEQLKQLNLETPSLEEISEWSTITSQEKTAHQSEEGYGRIDKALYAPDGKEMAPGTPLRLTPEELVALYRIGQYIFTIHSCWNKVNLWDGEYIDVADYAKQGCRILENTASMNSSDGVISKIMSFMAKIHLGNSDPRGVFRLLDNFDENGVLTKLYEAYAEGEAARDKQKIDFNAPFDDFFEEHKNYAERLMTEYVEYRGEKIRLGEAIYLHELLKRRDAKLSLLTSEIYYHTKGKEQKALKPLHDIKKYFPDNEKHRESSETIGLDYEAMNWLAINADALAEQEKLKKLFSAEDLEYCKLIENYFDVEARACKIEADMKFVGVTSTVDGFYIPQRVHGDSITTSIQDSKTVVKDFILNDKPTFAKHISENVKPLDLFNVEQIRQNHSHALATYMHVYMPIKAFDLVYNYNVAESGHAHDSVKQRLRGIWEGSHKYITELYQQVQGYDPSSNDDFSRSVRFLRKNFTRAVLGLKFTSAAKQLSAIPQMLNVVSARAVAYGTAHIPSKSAYEDMVKYSGDAAARFYNNTLVRSEAVIGDKFNRGFDKAAFFLLETADKYVIEVGWQAAQYEAQQKQGLAIGSEENKKAAGTILNRIIRETQANSSASERSAFQRSGNELMRTLMMFKSDSVKNYSRFAEGVARLIVTAKKKNAGTATKDDVDNARHALACASAGLIFSLSITVAISQLCKFLFKKERRDKDGNEISIARDAIEEFGSQAFSLLPLTGDIYEYLVSGYELEDNTFSMINSGLKSFTALMDTAGMALGGEAYSEAKMARNIRNVAYTIGEFTGMPVSTVEDYVNAIVSRVSPDTYYAKQNLFYPFSAADVTKELGKNETATAVAITECLYDSAGGTSYGRQKTVKELLRLYKLGYNDVLPKSVSTSITVNGEKVPLSKSEYSKYKNIYSKAYKEIYNLMKMPEWELLDDDTKASLVEKVYSTYQNQAKAAVNDSISYNKINRLAVECSYISMSKLLMALGVAEYLDSQGEKTAESILRYLMSVGYTQTEAEASLIGIGYSSKGLKEKYPEMFDNSQKNN